jgi:hypothetical protein
MLGHPASRLKGRPSAPAPLGVTLAVDGCMFMAVGVLALVNAPWWSVLVPLALGTPILVRYGRRAAVAMGIRCREETPRGWLLALTLPGGLVGVLATHTGRYGGLLIMTYIVLGQAGERIVWSRFRGSDARSLQSGRSDR